MELNAIPEREQAEPITVLWHLQIILPPPLWRESHHRCNASKFWLDYFLQAECDWVETGSKSKLAWCIGYAFEDVVLSYILVWSKSRLNGDNFASALARRPSEIIRKDLFRAFFFPTSPLSSFAYKHSLKYPYKRLMSLCSCILPPVGCETMHQSVHLTSLIHTPHENALMPQENAYW